jgi:PAS domain S-box-containing protein
MHFQYVPYIGVLLASAVITAALGVYSWRHRAVTGATSFTILMLVAVTWSLSNALEMAGTDLPTKLFWANVQYLCYVAGPMGWLVLALQYTGREQWLTRRNLALLAIVPLITVVLVWTNDLHGLMRRDVYLDTDGPFPIVGKTYGPWFWVHAAYSYTQFSISIYLFLQATQRASPPYRGQPLVLLMGILLPIVWNILYVIGLTPFPRHDISPAMFSVAGIVGAWGLLRFRLFDITPIAWATVIESMDDSVIVLDVQDQVVDLNLAAQRMLGRSASQTVGQPAEEVFNLWPGLMERYRGATNAQAELTLGDGEAQRAVDLRISPVSNRRNQLVGRVIVVRDVTERVRTEVVRRQAEEGQRQALADALQATRALRRYADEQAALYAVVSAAAVLLDPDQLLATVLDVVLRVVDADAGWVILPGSTPDDLPRVAAWRGIPESFVAAEEATPLRTCPICAHLLVAGSAPHGPTPMAECPRLPPETLPIPELQDHVGVPLSAGDEVLGVLDIAWRGIYSYSEADRALLAAIGQQVGLALHNAQLYQTARRVDRLQALNTITAAAVSSLELDVVLRQTLELTCQALDAATGIVLLQEPETEGLFLPPSLAVGVGGLCDLRLKPGQGIAGWVAQTGQAVRVNDVYLDPRWDDGVGRIIDFEIRSLLSVPLRHREEIIGVIEIANKRQGEFTDDDLSLLEAVAGIASGAMENARLYAATQTHAEELAMLHEIGLALTATLDPSAVVRVALSLIQRFFKTEGVALLQLVPQTGEMYTVWALAEGTPVETPTRLQLDEGIVGWVLRKRQPALIEDAQSDPRWLGRVDRCASQYLGKPVRGVMVVPLLTPEEATGVILVSSTEPGVYTHHELSTLQAIAATLAVALENARLYASEREKRTQLRIVTTRLAEVEEDERRRLARELHDQVGQNLIALGLNLKIVSTQVCDQEDRSEAVRGQLSNRLDDTAALVKQITTSIRNVMDDLRPPALEEFGLIAALHWYGTTFTSRVDVPVAIRGPEPAVRLPSLIEMALFRIAQEALTNVARHAEATRVTVTVTIDEETMRGDFSDVVRGEPSSPVRGEPSWMVRLVVADDGVGFDLQRRPEPGERQHWGLVTMAERAEAVGGSCRVESSPGEGTKVIVEVPL